MQNIKLLIDLIPGFTHPYYIVSSIGGRAVSTHLLLAQKWVEDGWTGEPGNPGGDFW